MHDCWPACIHKQPAASAHAPTAKPTHQVSTPVHVAREALRHGGADRVEELLILVPALLHRLVGDADNPAHVVHNLVVLLVRVLSLCMRS